MEKLIISVGIVALNEQDTVGILLNQLYMQNFSKKHTELVLVDSGSTDGTKAVFEEFRAEHADEYFGIAVLDNPRRIQAAGWNVAIDNFRGDALLRLDAHARIEKDFLSAISACLATGEMVCGGKRPNLPADNKPVSRLVSLADRSIFGGSFAEYHDSDGKKYVDTVFHACYRREVIEAVGHFNEGLGRTEDNDFHSRIRKKGYKICYDPKICSYQFSRCSVLGSIKQKYGNGYWIGRTTAVNPDCISLFHFVPFVFVMTVILSVFFGLVCSFLPFGLLVAAYGVADLLLSVTALISEKGFHPLFLLLPVLFAALHISYGVGTLVGFLSLLFKKS